MTGVALNRQCAMVRRDATGVVAGVQVQLGRMVIMRKSVTTTLRMATAVVVQHIITIDPEVAALVPMAEDHQLDERDGIVSMMPPLATTITIMLVGAAVHTDDTMFHQAKVLPAAASAAEVVVISLLLLDLLRDDANGDARRQ